MTETKKNKIDSYLEELPGLVLSGDKMTFSVPEGTVGQGLLAFHADGNQPVEGLIQSGSTRIVLAQGTFAGTNCQVEFGLDARGLKRGDSFRGKILFSGTIKPAEVFVRVNVVTADETLPVPAEVKNLSSFAELCRKNMREGFRLFSRGDFEDLLTGENAKYRLLYEGLSRNPVTYQHMEEFLVAAGQKEKLTFSLDREEDEEYGIRASKKGTIYIYRSGWGYAHLDVTASGRFLHVSKKTITTEDFIGKVYGLEYIIDYDALGEGRNNGTIRIESVHQTMIFRITAAKGSRQYRPAYLEKQKKTSWLMRDLINLHLHTLDYPSWQESSKMTVGELIQADDKDTRAHLYRAFLAWSEEDRKTALEELMKLRSAAGRLEDDEEEGVYLYLARKTDLLPQEKRNILPQLMRLYARHQDSYVLLSLVQREKGSILPVTKLKEMETCFNAGSSNPMLFLDAWNLIAGDEALLRSMSPFTIRVLGFGTRHGLMTESILSRAAYLSIVNMKRYSSALCRTFARGYNKFGSRDALEAILKLIIQGQPLDRENFPWYEKAIEQDLRIVRLYEYYMETCPYTAEYVIPAPVRMYFAYNNTLGDRTKALLYASVVLHRDQDSASYANYARQIRTFTADSLARGRIDENYMILYREFYSFPENKEKAEQAAAMIGARKFTCSDPSIRNLIVRSGAMKEEGVYPLSDGTAYPRLINDDVILLMEDGMKRRFPLDSSCTLTSLAELQGTAEQCLSLGIDSAPCELTVCGPDASHMKVTAENAGVYQMAAANPAFREEYRVLIRRKLLSYYAENPDDPGMDDFLGRMDAEEYGRTVRKETAELLIREGFYQKAFRIVTEFGHEDIADYLLVRLTSRIILSLEMEGDEETLALAEAVYSAGKYDDVILCYLRDFHKGSAADLARLWNKVTGFKLDAMNLGERILKRSIAEHSFPPYLGRILSSYIKGSGSHALIRDYCAFLSAQYFLKGAPVPDELFGWIEQILLGGWQLDKVCWMALLLHYTETDSLNDRQIALAEQILAVLNERGYRFRFWQELPTKLAQEFSVDDKVFVETNIQGADQVDLHYQITDKGADDAQWKVEPMKDRYHGIYSREFLMFYGETLIYYLTIEKDGKVEKTPVGRAAPPETEAGGRTKYRLLNRMLRARDVGDAPALEDALQTYLWQSAYVDSYFKLL